LHDERVERREKVPLSMRKEHLHNDRLFGNERKGYTEKEYRHSDSSKKKKFLIKKSMMDQLDRKRGHCRQKRVSVLLCISSLHFPSSWMSIDKRKNRLSVLIATLSERRQQIVLFPKKRLSLDIVQFSSQQRKVRCVE
jgi:hypothetical protein